MRPGHRGARAAGALVVVALHAALLWRWSAAPPASRAAGVAPRVAVRLLPAASPPRVPTTAPIVVAPPAAPVPERRAGIRARRQPVDEAPAPGSAAPAAAPAEAVPVAPEVAAAAAAASAPSVEAGLLDSDATRRAIRSAARDPLLAERAAVAGGEPVRLNPQQRLGQEVQRSARGDCLKGEYLGAGMGLLSVPFLAAAVLRDTCRH